MHLRIYMLKLYKIDNVVKTIIEKTTQFDTAYPFTFPRGACNCLCVM